MFLDGLRRRYSATESRSKSLQLKRPARRGRTLRFEQLEDRLALSIVGGVSLDPSPKTMTVNVTGVNGVPTITSLTPAAGSTNVATNATVNVAFNEALDPTTVNSTTAQLLTGMPSTTTSLWNASSTPTTADSGDGHAIEVGVKFTADVNGIVTGIWFYKSAANTGTHVANLWSSTGATPGHGNLHE